MTKGREGEMEDGWSTSKEETKRGGQVAGWTLTQIRLIKHSVWALSDRMTRSKKKGKEPRAYT